jgi:hypothetical protein
MDGEVSMTAAQELRLALIHLAQVVEAKEGDSTVDVSSELSAAKLSLSRTAPGARAHLKPDVRAAYFMGLVA